MIKKGSPAFAMPKPPKIAPLGSKSNSGAATAKRNGVKKMALPK